MKLCHRFVLLCLAVILWAAVSEASPLNRKSDESTAAAAVAVPRQASGSAPAAVDDDEDDDDDDEEVADIEDVLDDDDDDDDEDDDAVGAADDDEDEDDDDDGDYLDRFFDDILGEEDDEDDEDDISPAAVQQQVIQEDPVQQVVQASDNAVETIQADATAPEAYEDDQQFDQIDNDISGPTNVKDDLAQEASAPVAAKPAADDDEDEDDEDDEVEDLVEPLDDDDDDEDEDDDDEDDLIGDDVIEARSMQMNKKKSQKTKATKKKEAQKKLHRHTRSAAPKSGNKAAAAIPVESKQSGATYIEDETFNYYVDTIFKHLNEILQRDYDPVTVPLVRRSLKPKKSRNASEDTAKDATQHHEASSTDAEERKAATSTKQSGHNPQTTTESQLFGLSTLKRVGNVKISRKNPAVEEDFTTIKSNFKLGPLTLKVQKITTRPGQKNYKKVRSATATTAEMLGRINLRVKNGVASLYSIKVQQPKQVKVESDNSPASMTRDLVWKRSAAISRAVSDSLKDAAHAVDFENLN